MYFVLLIILILLSIFVFFLNKKDLLSPSLISCLVYIFCTIFAIFGQDTWNNIDISWKLIGIVTVGLTSFCFGEFVIRKILKNNNNSVIKKDDNHLEPVHIEKWKVILAIAFIVVEILLLFFEIKRISQVMGFNDSNFLKMFAFYREKSQLFSTEMIEKNISINIIVSQFNKLCSVLGVTFIFILIRNIINKDNIKNNIIYSIPVILCLILSVMTGSRSQIIKYIIATIIISFILYSKRSNFKDILKKMIIIFIVGIITILPIFYITLPLFGRKQDKDFVGYISFYLGCSIPSFERYLENPPQKDSQFGSESLRGINSLLYKTGIIKNMDKISREWTVFPRKL